MDIGIHRVSEIAAEAADFEGIANCRDFSRLKLRVRTSDGKAAEINIFAPVGAPFAQIAAAVNAAYAKKMAQKGEAA